MTRYVGKKDGNICCLRDISHTLIDDESIPVEFGVEPKQL